MTLNGGENHSYSISRNRLDLLTDALILILNTEVSRISQFFMERKGRTERTERTNKKNLVSSTILAKELCSALLVPQGAPLILATRDVVSGFDWKLVTSDMS